MHLMRSFKYAFLELIAMMWMVCLIFTVRIVHSTKNRLELWNITSNQMTDELNGRLLDDAFYSIATVWLHVTRSLSLSANKRDFPSIQPNQKTDTFTSQREMLFWLVIFVYTLRLLLKRRHEWHSEKPAPNQFAPGVGHIISRSFVICVVAVCACVGRVRRWFGRLRIDAMDRPRYGHLICL